MSSDLRHLSVGFQRLYCDPSVLEPFSSLHPICFRHVLPFRTWDTVLDDPHVIFAEQAHLADRTDNTRLAVVDAYARCGLLQEAEATDLKSVIDYFATEFFDVMGQTYANMGMFRCALRWYRELIQVLETATPSLRSDEESVYGSVGYCLYSLGLFEEAIAWSKSCLGPRLLGDAVAQALMGYEAQQAGGIIKAIEHTGFRTRYTLSALEPAVAHQDSERVKAAVKNFAPFQEIYIDWVGPNFPAPEILPNGYPFNAARDSSSFPRHKMNLIFATCGHAALLVERGYNAEAKRLLHEVAMLEPEASFVWDRIELLP
jgi:tetratricopeptide (TPR) repeat protein